MIDFILTCLSIILVCMIYYRYLKKEMFNVNELNVILSNKVLKILPLLHNKENNNSYIGCYLPNSGRTQANLVKKITPLNIKDDFTNLEQNDLNNYFITDITYDKDKKLIGIIESLENGKSKFQICKKESENVTSPWIIIESNSKSIKNINIRSVCYDILSKKLIGVHGEDNLDTGKNEGNLFIKETDDIESNWVAIDSQDLQEIPADKNGNPVKIIKLMYDIDDILICIASDGCIYKKNKVNWKESPWVQKNSITDETNNIKITDLIHDVDGCLIAFTNGTNDIYKQTERDFKSPFIKIEDSNKDKNKILDLSQIIKFKTGIDFGATVNLSENLNNNLKKMLNFKQKIKSVCSNRHKDRNLYDTEILKVSEQNNKLKNIEDLIFKIKNRNFK